MGSGMFEPAGFRGETTRFVIYAFDPDTNLGGVLNDQGKQVADFNQACVFTSFEAVFLMKENCRYHAYVLQLMY